VFAVFAVDSEGIVSGSHLVWRSCVVTDLEDGQTRVWISYLGSRSRMIKHGGDDLEDDFILDDLVAFSEGEDDGNYVDIGDGALALADDAELHGEAVDTARIVTVADTGRLDKKRKGREKEKKAKVRPTHPPRRLFCSTPLQKKRKLAEDGANGNESFTAAEPPLKLTHYLALMQAKTFHTLSKMELEDMRIPGV
jgi:protein CMS1